MQEMYTYDKNNQYPGTTIFVFQLYERFICLLLRSLRSLLLLLFNTFRWHSPPDRPTSIPFHAAPSYPAPDTPHPAVASQTTEASGIRQTMLVIVTTPTTTPPIKAVLGKYFLVRIMYVRIDPLQSLLRS